MKALCVVLALFALGLLAGCGRQSMEEFRDHHLQELIAEEAKVNPWPLQSPDDVFIVQAVQAIEGTGLRRLVVSRQDKTRPLHTSVLSERTFVVGSTIKLSEIVRKADLGGKEYDRTLVVRE